ncbi:MAG: endonuclease III domain-containing protein [Proteobacteria bacterium]|nr:endonuclease III domain-containing protein [Pseudomonadota bacterium]MBU1640891.1 endonuclease III domain-containing protein [Pseudomonadota bacterium]
MHRLQAAYHNLFDYFGPQHWWPGDTTLEILVGAVLTQNTNWANVSKAIANLKQEGVLSLEALSVLPADQLAEMIRPSGYFNLKAQRLKNLLTVLGEEVAATDSLADFFSQDLFSLREKLLSVKGIGPETADSILLYAGQKPIFVVDTYTYRFLSRHGLVGEESSYEEMQELFMAALPAEVGLYNEYHALLVCLGKEFCKKNDPRCEACPLQGDLPGH